MKNSFAVVEFTLNRCPHPYPGQMMTPSHGGVILSVSQVQLIRTLKSRTNPPQNARSTWPRCLVQTVQAWRGKASFTI
jgi:hypothetical protein